MRDNTQILHTPEWTSDRFDVVTFLCISSRCCCARISEEGGERQQVLCVSEERLNEKTEKKKTNAKGNSHERTNARETAERKERKHTRALG
jgi:hypothetical protein